MRVCLVTGEFPPAQGGIGDYTAELSKALVAAGVEVHVVTKTLPHEGPGGYGTPDLVAERQPVAHRTVGGWGWSCWRRIADVLRTARPDILHIQYQAAAYDLHPAINMLPWRLRFSGALSVPVITTFHDLRVPYLFPKAGPLRWQVVLAQARGSAGVVVTNTDDERRLEPLGLPMQRIPIGSNIHPNPPIDFKRTEHRTRLGIGPEDFVICHFGFVNERKGIDTLLNSLWELRDRTTLPGEPRLLMIGGKVGSSDPTNVAYLKQVEAMVEDLGLTSVLVWTGFVPAEEVSAAFMAADCCVLPFREGASLQHGTLMAALAHGMAIVSTLPPVESGNVCPSELKNGENILLVPSGDPVRLAEAISRLANRTTLVARLSAGALLLSQSFSWEGIAQRHLEMYHAVA